MATPLLPAVFYVVLTSTCALLAEHPQNVTLSVLLLASTDSSYNTSPSTLSEWVNDLLIKGAKENWGYQLQLSILDTKVRVIVHGCKNFELIFTKFNESQDILSLCP